MKGIKRFRQAIKNQRDLGNGDLRLTYQDAEKLCCEIEEELLGICRSAEREIGKYAWVHGVPAPVDADGEVVPLTTKVMYDDDGEELTVRLICYRQSDGGWVAEFCRPCAAIMDTLAKFHLRRPDTWERLEEDAARIGSADCPCDYFNHPDCSVPCYSCPAFTDAEDCTAVLARDVLRRAKALAEREAKEASRD